MKMCHKQVVEEHNKTAEEYDSWYNNSYSRFVEDIETDILLQFLNDKKDVLILDAAGGTARLAIRLAEKGFNVHCVDLAERMLEVGRKKASKKGLQERICFINADITCLDNFKDNTFDFTFCFGTALSYCNAEEVLREFSRVTKKGSFIVVDFKSFYRNLGRIIIDRRVELEDYLKTKIYNSKYHTYNEINYTIDDVEKLIKHAGLKLTNILGKSVFNNYFENLSKQQLELLFQDKNSLEEYKQHDWQLRERRDLIPMCLEIVAIIKNESV